jgi:F0F1-type ATP synthase beta subunit
MARIKQCQNTGRLIDSINAILKNRCSLSEEDNILTEAIVKLHLLKKKKGKTNKEILETGVEAIELIAKYFKS